MSLVGSYVVLQINPKAMVAEYADRPIYAVAKALAAQKYIALVDKVRMLSLLLKSFKNPLANVHAM